MQILLGFNKERPLSEWRRRTEQNSTNVWHWHTVEERWYGQICQIQRPMGRMSTIITNIKTNSHRYCQDAILIYSFFVLGWRRRGIPINQICRLSLSSSDHFLSRLDSIDFRLIASVRSEPPAHPHRHTHTHRRKDINPIENERRSDAQWIIDDSNANE